VSQDFAPDLLRIQQQAPPKMPRVLLLSSSALAGIALIWASFAKLDIVAVAEGRLIPVSFTKPVQVAESGVVREILVADGQLVKAGDVLVRLDPQLAASEQSGLQTDQSLKRLQLARIEAELGGKPFVVPAGTAEHLKDNAQAQYLARTAAYRDSVAQEEASRARALSEQQAGIQVLERLQATLPILRKAADSFEKLQRDGFVGEVAANEKRRELMEREREIETQKANLQTLKAAVNQTQTRLTSLASNYRAQLQSDRAELLLQLNKAGSELQRSELKSAFLEVKAPYDGVVKDLAVTGRGSVVSVGTPLMTLVPQGEKLQAEVLVRNEDIGFIRQGSTVRLKVAAYPFQKYGLMNGTVQMLSADSIDPRQQQTPGANTLAYRAFVALNEQTLTAGSTGQTYGLAAGMIVSAELSLGQRTVIEYLLSPVKKVAAEAGRER
jgi:hemolysin D